MTMMLFVNADRGLGVGLSIGSIGKDVLIGRDYNAARTRLLAGHTQTLSRSQTAPKAPEASNMDPSDALSRLNTPPTLSILTLTRPILRPPSPSKRTSTNSTSSDTDALRTPSAIQADLIHYQELFSKLRFSYVEQVTKERFLRAVTAEVPEFVAQGENAELEEKLRGDKEALRAKKEEVRGLIGVLEEQGRGLAGRE